MNSIRSLFKAGERLAPWLYCRGTRVWCPFFCACFVRPVEKPKGEQGGASVSQLVCDQHSLRIPLLSEGVARFDDFRGITAFSRYLLRPNPLSRIVLITTELCSFGFRVLSTNTYDLSKDSKMLCTDMYMFFFFTDPHYWPQLFFSLTPAVFYWHQNVISLLTPASWLLTPNSVLLLTPSLLFTDPKMTFFDILLLTPRNYYWPPIQFWLKIRVPVLISV